jgi:16S rRNA (cytosine967-C5)-methyltransferase
MSKYFSHLNTAKNIIAQYKGEMPLAAYLKNFFSKEKKYGSRDRRSISSLCYSFYRTGHLLKQFSVEEKMLAGLFLSGTQPGELLSDQKPGWNDIIQLLLQEKLKFLKVDVNAIFPFNKELSKDIDKEAFNRSLLIQPKLFIRIRPSKQALVERKLAEANIGFERIKDDCFAFENGTRLEDVLETNRDYVVQDYNSQQVFSLLSFLHNSSSSLNVWDCCAASGGKSIQASDVLKNIQLTVSDVRSSILNNLHQRLKAAGIKNYHSFEADLTQAGTVQSRFSNRPFDLVICDAPCSGSGTWSRTPEQLAFFKAEEIDRYSSLQKKIAGNVTSAVRKNGLILYVTCSVFKKENEDVVQHLIENYPVTLVKMELLKGYEMQADSMFAAVLQVQ